MKHNNDLLAGGEPLMLRSDPELQTRDITCRTITLRAATIDETNRSVEVGLTSEGMVTVYDYMSGRAIQEVLVTEGGEWPDQVPLLANHNRWSLDGVLGSIRNIRKEGNGWVGRAFFAEGDAEADKAWNKVRQGHLRDISSGYRALPGEFEEIPPSTSRIINGRTYTAGNTTLRITKRWQGKEGSLVPIGADPTTKTRGQGDVTSAAIPPAASGKDVSMNPLLRQYLESLGLRHDATVDQAQAFLSALGGEQKVRADAIGAGTMTLEQARAAVNPTPAPAPSPVITGQRQETPAPVPAPVVPAAASQTPEQIRAAERERLLDIRSLARTAGDVPAELVTRAENENWTAERASAEFLRHMQGSRTAPLGNDAPAAIVRDHARDCTRSELGLALAMRAGVQSDAAIQVAVRRAGIRDSWENVAQRADRYRDMSMFDLCREAIRLDGGTVGYGRDETIRAAVSGGSLTNIFTTSINARLMMAWDEETDTTTLWVAETEAPNFKANDDIDVTANARLERHARGGTAKHANTGDTKESWRLTRFSKQFVVDEQDIIDDNFAKLQTYPEEFGKAGRRLRPDLVYSLLLANPTLSADSVALFHSDHNNLGSGGGSALQESSMKTATKAMASQKLGSGKDIQRLNIRPAFLIVPPDLEWTGRGLISSAEIRDTTANTRIGTRNVIQDLNLQLISEGRLDATGVLDPTTDSIRTGSATNWFLASKPGRTIKVGYLRGSGRGPAIRVFNLDKGQWGIGCDVKMDIAAAVDDYRGIYKSAGA